MPGLDKSRNDIDRYHACQHRGRALAKHQYLATLDPVDDRTGWNRDHDERNARHETDEPDKKCRISEIKRHPAECNGLHPQAKLCEYGTHPAAAKQGILLEGVEEPIGVVAFSLGTGATLTSNGQT